jgi:hypothetical protein
VKITKIETLFNPYKNIKKDLYFLCKQLLMSNKGIQFTIPYQALECFVTFNGLRDQKILIGFNQQNAKKMKLRSSLISFLKVRNATRFEPSTLLENKEGFSPVIFQDDYGPDWEENKSVFVFPLFCDEKVKIIINNNSFKIDLNNPLKNEQKIFKLIKNHYDNKQNFEIRIFLNKKQSELRILYENSNILFNNTNNWFESFQKHIKEEKLAFPFYYSQKDEDNFIARHGMLFEEVKSVSHIIKNHINNDISYNLELLDLELKFDAFSNVEITDIENKYRDFNKLYKKIKKQLKNK